MNGAHCFPEGRYQCKGCLPRAWLQRAAEPREPSWPSWAQQCPGLSTILQAPLGAPSPNPALPLARRTSGLGILESVLEYQQEILLALLSLNLCLLDSGQCPKGVCCPGCVSCRKRERSPFPPTPVCVSAFEPVGNAFYSVPRHSTGFQQPWEHGVERGRTRGCQQTSTNSSETCSGGSVLCGHDLGAQSDLSSSGGHQGSESQISGHF